VSWYHHVSVPGIGFRVVTRTRTTGIGTGGTDIMINGDSACSAPPAAGQNGRQLLGHG